MRKIIFLAFFISPVITLAQIDFGSPSATSRGGSVTAVSTDWEAIEINPSNLGWKSNPKFTMGLANIGINVQDNGVNVPLFKQIIQNADSLGTKTLGKGEIDNLYSALTG